MDKKSIQAKIRALSEEGQKIIDTAKSEKRKLSEDDSKRLDEIKAELNECDEDLKRCNKVNDFEKRISGYKEPETEAVEAPVQTREDESGQVVEDRKNYHAWPVEEADQWFRCIEGLTSKNGVGIPDNVHEDYRSLFEQRAPTGVGTLIDKEAGFLVPSTISQTILRKIHAEGNLVSRCQNVPITVGKTAEWNALQENARTSGSRYGGITVGRVAEAGSPTASKPSFERVKLELKKLAALIYFTEEQLSDGPQAMTIVNEIMPRAFTFHIEDEIFNGNGGDAMEGVLNTPALVSVAKESGQAAATVLYENIVKIYSRMYAPSRPNAVWFINQDIEPQLFTMSLAVGTGGVPVYMPANGAAGSPFATLMGRPVVPIEHAATLGTVGDIVLADMSQYLYATKGGLSIAQSMHVKFVEGELAMRATLRNDGKSWWPSALTPAKGSNTQSPFVALATRS